VSITPDRDAWNQLTRDEQTARIQRHVAAHGRSMTDPEARQAAERYMADRQGKRVRQDAREGTRARLPIQSDAEKLMADQGRPREELVEMERTRQRRAGRSR
jgi:hypothetical protein